MSHWFEPSNAHDSAMEDEVLSAEESRVRASSADLLDLIERLERWGLLEGAVRASVARSLEVFRLRHEVDPRRTWEPGLVELYERLHGRPAGPPGD